MTAKQKANLMALASGLRRVPRAKFKMDFWGEGKLDTKSETFDCGYAGCAIGWAPKLIPGCRLRLIPDGDTFFVPHYQGSTGMNAVMQYFGIEYSDATYLFSTAQYETASITPIQVSNRILKFLAGRFTTEGK